MLTKVSPPNHLATNNIIKFIITHNENEKVKGKGETKLIKRIQDNLSGYLLIQYMDSSFIQYNYYLNKWYSHNKIQIDFNGIKIIKQIDSFDQNNWMIGNKLRNYVLNRIKQINEFEFKISAILGIGGEYYLYWVGLMERMKNIDILIGISNHKSIIEDAKLNIPWSNNYIVDYNKLSSYPQINSTDLVLINLFQINSNVIKYLTNIKFKKIILIACNLSDSKLKLLKNFKLEKIKYFINFDSFLRVIELVPFNN